MAFRVGQSVLVRSLKKNGTIVEATASGRYRVAIGDLVMSCKEDDLVDRPARGASRPTALRTERTATDASDFVPALDLHGKTTAEAVDATREWLNKILMSGAERAVVNHGHGTGRVREAVHGLLRTIPAVKSFRIMPDNAGNTEVFF